MKEYRGHIPFLLKDIDGSIIYLCSSNRNIEDYYDVLTDIDKRKVVKIESFEDEDRSINENYDILDLAKEDTSFILLLSLEGATKEYFREGKRYPLKLGEIIDLKELVTDLEKNHFEPTYMVEKRGQYSIRGDVVDIFPQNTKYPLRIELGFEDEATRLTYFDLETQKTIEKIEAVDMYIDSNKNRAYGILDIFSEKIEREEIKIFLENRELLRYKLDELKSRSEKDTQVLEKRYEKFSEISQNIEIIKFTHQEIESFENQEYIKSLGEIQDLEVKIVSSDAKRYGEIFNYPNFTFEKYPLYEGYREGSTLVLTDRELKGIRVKREKKRGNLDRYTNLREIVEGDYIIHENFGVGQYLGIDVIEDREYLMIRYADEDKLFVPVENISKIGRYYSPLGEIPEIYKLGRSGFKKKREKITGDILEFAREIVEIQAKRETQAGFQFLPDTVMQEEFEEGFLYTETPSQLQAIKDVKQDMESPRVMDRVVCGDVGYGKTEVAIRASFKAVMSHKQVAILVPTTVLAQQHFERFVERFKNYPINIEVLSRLAGSREQEEILERVKNGGADVVIGTHRLLSDDVKFRDLGLIIVDEEQKFGVKAKEKLKDMRNLVDMLTLTATPIPRTLNLALLGIRDLSIIDTPPQGRRGVVTHYMEGLPQNIKDVVMYEIAREGQVFYVYNSVRGMKNKVEELAKILPNYLKLDYIHGRMLPREIKEKLKDFENGDIDILVATTIIENGIDIENANTMIIDRADKLGLSQIYQLRGRIGRGNRQGFCYLINREFITKKAQKREDAIKEIENIQGTGLDLAMEDMKIRGAGEILGEKQHGALETLGYTLYMKMLEEEIGKIKGEMVEDNIDIEIKVNYPAYIPTKYIENSQKIKLYRRVGGIKSEGDLTSLEEEVADRFGKLPPEAVGYFKYAKLKLRAMKNGILKGVEIKGRNMSEIWFYEDRMNFEKVMKLLKEERIRYIKNSNSIEFDGLLDEFLDIYEN